MSDRIAVDVSAGTRLPGVLPRVALVVLSTGAFLVAPPVPAAIAVGLSVVGAVFPALPAAWGGMLIIALAQLAAPETAGDVRLYGALALVHLLHVVAALATVVDRRGTLQARVLVRPLRRWLAIQVPAQVLLAAVLLVHDRVGVTGAAVAPIVAALGAGIAIAVVVRLAARR